MDFSVWEVTAACGFLVGGSCCCFPLVSVLLLVSELFTHWLVGCFNYCFNQWVVYLLIFSR